MKKCIKGRATNEIANRFIWSAGSLYMRNAFDSMVLFSPIKYWKCCDILPLHNESTYIFNRKHFHATPSSICCTLWSNTNDSSQEIRASIYDIENDSITRILPDAILKKCHGTFSDKFYEPLKQEIASKSDAGILSGTDGYEFVDNSRARVKPLYHDDIIGYLVAQQFDFSNPALKSFLTRCAVYNGNGFYLTTTNYIKKLPLFAACKFLTQPFYLNGTIYTTSDGGNTFENDSEFLKECLIFTALSQYNKCLSFKGSDGRDYFNEICFDDISEHMPKALEDLRKLNLNSDEKSLIQIWNKILKKASMTKNYDKNKTYGLYQIIQELNTTTRDASGNITYDYPDLNGDINTLKTKLKEYYKKYIEPKCFKYQLLK